MAISTVRVKINNVWTNMTLNEETGKYEGIIVAPSVTSFNLSGKYYPVTVEVSNDAGTVVTKDDTDSTLGESLRLVVKETVKPTITLTSPTDGAYVQNNMIPVEFTVTDEVNGSGIKESSISIKVDGLSVFFTKTSITNGFSCVYTPEDALEDGAHIIEISAQDNDGNEADSVNTSFTVDTVPPALNVTSPTRAITNQTICTVSGNTNDTTSSPVTVTVTHNDNDPVVLTVDASGNFTQDFTLTEGNNTLIVVSTDASGRSTTVEKTIKLDTTIPQITSVVFAPNPTSTSLPVTITLEVV